jgi:hypothetical protein
MAQDKRTQTEQTTGTMEGFPIISDHGEFSLYSSLLKLANSLFNSFLYCFSFCLVIQFMCLLWPMANSDITNQMI